MNYELQSNVNEILGKRHDQWEQAEKIIDKYFCKRKLKWFSTHFLCVLSPNFNICPDVTFAGMSPEFLYKNNWKEK